MNLIDIEDRLKDFSDQQLMQQMQRPDGMAPQFLVMSELKRRKEMRGRAPSQPDPSTVKDDLLSQGIGSGMPPPAPPTQMPMPPQPMPPQQMPPQQMQMQMQQQQMPQDGIPRFKHGALIGGSAVQPHPGSQPELHLGNSSILTEGVLHPNQLSQTAREKRISAEKAQSGANSYAVKPRNLIQRQYAPGTLPPSMLGDVTPKPENPVPGYAENDIGLAPKKAFADGSQMYAGDFVTIDPARGGDFPNFGVDAPPAATSTNTAKQISPPAELVQRERLLSGVQLVERPSAATSNGGMNYADEIAKLTAPSATAGAPAAPAQNYYEGIEKKLAALQAAETGPNAGMALLRAGLGIAQAGGKGESTAAAIGAGGMAGLDAYEAQKKASETRNMALLGVESSLAGAKTKQSYDEQSLALQARQRDIAERSLQLNALGQLNDNETRLIIAKSSDDLKRVSLDLERIKIDDAARTATEKLRIMEDEGVVKKGYYESIVRKNDKGDAIDRFIAAPPEIRELIKPLLVKANSSALMGKIGNSAMELIAEPLWLADTKDRLTEKLGRTATMNDAVAEARKLAEKGYGVRQFREQNNDPVNGVRR